MTCWLESIGNFETVDDIAKGICGGEYAGRQAEIRSCTAQVWILGFNLFFKGNKGLPD